MTGPAPRALTTSGLLAPAAAAAAGTALATAATHPLRALGRRNFQGRDVSLSGGVGTAVGSVLAACAAGRVLARHGLPVHACVAGAAATTAGAAAGLVDDLDDGAHDGQAPAKGLRGHLGALARGRVTTGALKVAVIGGGALVAGTLLALQDTGPAPRRRGATAADTLTRAVAIASWANVVNLLDLRPGRALKATALASTPLLLPTRPGGAPGTRLLATGALAASLTALPLDLRERTMAGDTGANAVGALLGTALACHPSPVVRAGAAATGTGLVLASEKVSFSAVISTTPVLAWLDALGRRRA